MIDYKQVIESLIARMKSLHIEVEFIEEPSRLRIEFKNGYVFGWNATRVTNEEYKLLLESMIIGLLHHPKPC